MNKKNKKSKVKTLCTLWRLPFQLPLYYPNWDLWEKYPQSTCFERMLRAEKTFIRGCEKGLVEEEKKSSIKRNKQVHWSLRERRTAAAALGCLRWSVLHLIATSGWSEPCLCVYVSVLLRSHDSPPWVSLAQPGSGALCVCAGDPRPPTSSVVSLGQTCVWGVTNSCVVTNRPHLLRTLFRKASQSDPGGQEWSYRWPFIPLWRDYGWMSGWRSFQCRAARGCPDVFKMGAVFSEPQLVWRLPGVWWCHGWFQEESAAPSLSPETHFVE